MVEQSIKLKALHITKSWRNDSPFPYDCEVKFEIEGHTLEIKLSQEQTEEMIKVCAGAIVKASAEAAEGMRRSVNKSMNLIEEAKAE